MIDIQKAKVAFKEYLSYFDQENHRIKLKIIHTYGVIKCAEYISKKKNLNQEEKDLAILIALLHDIGRFEQLKEYDSFDDNLMDHAEFGVKLLFEDNLIRNFIQDEKYYEIIYKAILNHSKYNIERDNYSEQELLQVKIIRDADKMDIFRVNYEESFYKMSKIGKENIEKDNISDDIYNDFMSAKLLKKDNAKTYLDKWVLYIAFIFDLNFRESFEWIKENNSINKLFDRVELKIPASSQKYMKMRTFANEYINKKIN